MVTRLLISLNDGSDWLANAQQTTERYETGYVDALQYLNVAVKTIVENAVARERERGRRVAFYIQGDHGGGSQLNLDNMAETDLRERHSILLAARYPQAADYLYPDITPVNAVRALVNATLGSQLPFLSDRVLFSTWQQPYQFSDVSDRVR